ncbi:hypothetical protein BGX23_000948 [Mortierella sp. AD031]|nr:hypothetical protein BGX23_000948 [Mortierella sp. AD031]
MKSACHKFLELPELICLVGERLSPHCLVQFMSVNKYIYSICIPLLYRHLDLFWDRRKRNILYGFSRNVHHIKTIILTGEFFGDYYAGLRAFQDIQDQSSPASPPRRPQWLPEPWTILNPVIPFPPMTNLTSLTVRDKGLPFRGSQLMTDYDSGAYMKQLWYVLQHCRRLTRLVLRDIPVHTKQDLELLARTVAGLDRLQRLQLLMQINEKGLTGQTIISTLVFGLPPSIKSVSFDFYKTMVRRDDNSAPNTTTPLFDEPLERRLEPLRQLTSWQGKNGPYTDINLFCAMIKRCQEIVELEMPMIGRGSDVVEMSQLIARHCPSLAKVSQADQDSSGSMIIAVAGSMQEQRLESFTTSYYNDKNGRLASTLLRHSTTLTTIEIDGSNILESRVIQSILCSCRALEVFGIWGNESDLYEKIDLGDAVANPWASTSFRELRLVINIGDSEVLKRDVIYAKDWPESLPPNDERRYSQLEKLYRQIGSLTALETLDLEVAMDPEEDELGYQDVGFPGWLSLGDATTGRAGYLELLLGLKKLKCLKGSVSAMSKMAKMTVGKKEVSRMLESWLRLEEIELFPGMDEGIVRPWFSWLRGQAPHWQLGYIG